MNKQKFEKKCKLLYTYEDEMLAKINEYVSPYNDDLNKYGYKIVPRLFWFGYPLPDENDYKSISVRKSIQYKRPYRCYLSVAICPIDEDLDEDINDDHGMAMNDWVSAYTLTIWRAWFFQKGKCKYIYKNLPRCCEEIKEFGMEYVVHKFVNKYKSTN